MIFFKNIRGKGLKYAISVKFMYAYEHISIKSVSKWIERNICDKLYDYAYSIDCNNTEPVNDYIDESYATPCGCTLFNDCRECGSYAVCG